MRCHWPLQDKKKQRELAHPKYVVSGDVHACPEQSDSTLLMKEQPRKEVIDTHKTQTFPYRSLIRSFTSFLV